MPTQAIIPVTPGSGLDLDAVSLTIGPNTVFREVLVIADPSNATYLATVNPDGTLNVALPSAQAPPSAAAIGTAVATDLLIGTQVAGSSVPVALPTATITALTPPSAATIAAAIVANPPAVLQGTSPWVVASDLTHNNAAPSTANLGVLAAVANAAAPTFTEGNQVLLSTDLAGNLRTSGTFTGTVTGAVTGTLTNNNAAPSTNNIGALTVLANAADPTWTEGDLVTASANLAGYQRVLLHAETTKVIGTVNIAAAQTVAVTNVGTFAVQEATLDAAVGATGGAVPAKTQQVGGSDGTDLRTISTDTLGNQMTRPAAPTTGKWLLAVINTNGTAGAQQVIAGVPSQTVRVMRIMFVNCSTTTLTTVTIQDGAPTVFSGPMLLYSGGSINGIDANGEPLYTTGSGEGFFLNTSAAVPLCGTVWYSQS